MKYEFIAVGGATEDITFYTEEGVLIDNHGDILRQKLLAFEFGTKIKIDRTEYRYGGGAVNAAVGLVRLGFKTAALICVGADERGKRIIANMKKEGVGASLAQVTKKRESSFSFILMGPGSEHIVFSNRASNEELKIKVKQQEILDSAEWVYITSLSGAWELNLKRIFALKKAKVAWNPGHVQLEAGYKGLAGFIAKTAVITMNKDETLEIVVSDPRYKDESVDFLNNPENLSKVIQSWGAKIAVITDGENGSFAYDGQRLYYQPIFKAEQVVNTTGVGDAYGSTFVAGMMMFSGDIQKAMRLAALNAGAVVKSLGAQTGLLRKKDILKMQ